MSNILNSNSNHMASDLSQPIYISNLLHRFASFSFNEIEKLLDENSGEESQKRSLMRNLHEIYTLGTKIHMAIKFDSKFRYSRCFFIILLFMNNI